jgi:hypothetical protein
MAVPLNSLTPAEIEFLAEEELVTIVPRVTMDTLHFLSVRVCTQGRARRRGRGQRLAADRQARASVRRRDHVVRSGRSGGSRYRCGWQPP